MTELINETLYSWALLGSLSKGVIERQTAAGGGFFAFSCSTFTQIFWANCVNKNIELYKCGNIKSEQKNRLTSGYLPSLKNNFLNLRLRRTTELSTVWKSPSKWLSHTSTTPNGSALGSSRRRPTPPPPTAMLWTKKTSHFHPFSQNSTLCGVGGEGRGRYLY